MPFHHVRKVYEKRLANYRKIFESHKENYCKNPLAQKLLALQAQKEEIESRIKACDDEITRKQKELDSLTGNKLHRSLFTWTIIPPPFIYELFLCPAKYSPPTEDLQHRYFSVKCRKLYSTFSFSFFIILKLWLVPLVFLTKSQLMNPWTAQLLSKRSSVVLSLMSLFLISARERFVPQIVTFNIYHRG